MIKKILHRIYWSSKTLRFWWTKFSWYRAKIKLYISDEKYAKEFYFKNIGKEINLECPKTYDEKICYLKLNNHDPLLTRCSDKYLVRDYVKECGLSHILTKLYGVYDRVEDIDFNTLHDSVFIKCNHTSNGNIIYNKNKPFDFKEFKRYFKFMLKQNYYVISREWNYKDIVPKIICEEVLTDYEGNLPLDYKFLCFNGEPKLMYLCIGTCSDSGKHAKLEERYLNIYDMDFNFIPITKCFNVLKDDSIKKPENFELMKEYACILSKPFIHCRVDFYDIRGKVYFGEITCYDSGGCNNVQPEEWALKMGDWIDLSRVKQ